ncbi:DUF5342 family protein [Bacillus solimangrovi]|uniref:YheE family protein n=1 Tax=Bacillus solimangrovi TaxID=1305675 RepID=A0A1E5LFV1_9BACI|nr:DUF5342 family protein [Bacillus solimangrovi]OEH92936.1 hypothetical protein BFG57_14275 [Bacillus solimangrovi]
MISHFQYKERNKDLAGWSFSFFYKKTRYSGLYHRNGEVEWYEPAPENDKKEYLQSHLHELMLFHVYEEK